MKIMTMSESRAHYAQTLDSVVDDREEVVVARPNGKNVVIVSEDEYASLKETAYLLSSPANAARLLASIEHLTTGSGTFLALEDLPQGQR